MIIGLGEEFLDQAGSLKGEIDKLDIIKTKTFCTSKDTVRKMKSQAPVWEKIFANSRSDKGFASRIYNELMQLNNKTKQFFTHKNKV